MGLDAKQVRSWTRQFTPTGDALSWSVIANQSGVPLGTLTVQRTKNNIDAKVVLAVARANGKNALMELSSFEGYSSLAKTYDHPGIRELLTQVPLRDLFSEITTRLQETPRQEPYLGPWGEVERGLAAWFGLRGHDYGTVIRRILQIGEQSASRKVNKPQFKVDQIVPVADALELNPKFALLILGYINENEAEIEPLAREKALHDATADDLSDHLDHILRHVRRRLNASQQQAEDEEISMRLS